MEVKGIELFVKADEMAQHAAKRAEFHAQRAEAYAKKVAELREMRTDNPAPTFDGDGMGTLKAAVSNSYHFNQDPLTALEDQARSHRGLAERFRFIASHTCADATYRLSLNDLNTLEIGA